MNHPLSLLVLVQALGGISVLLAPRTFSRPLAQAFTTLTLGFGGLLLAWFHQGVSLVEPSLSWIPAVGARFALGLDATSLPFLLLTLVATWAIALDGFRTEPTDRVRSALGLTLLSSSAMIGCLAALDALLFYLFWEAMLLPAWLLVGTGTPARRRAAFRFVVFTLAGSLILLVTLLELWRLGGMASTAVADLLSAPVPASEAPWIYLGLLLAFGVKAALFPLHAWLPDTYVEAPAGGTVLLSAILAKAGLYGLLRFAVPLEVPTLAAAGLALATVGVVWAAFLAFGQRDLKRMLAFASMSHVSVALAGVFAGGETGHAAAVFQGVAHGLATTVLFLAADAWERRQATRDLESHHGLARPMPRFAACLTAGVLAAVGLPGLAGFVGEFLALTAAFQASWPAAVALVLGAVTGTAALLRATQRVLYGPPPDPAPADLDPSETTILAVPLLFLLVLGVRPGLLLPAPSPVALPDGTPTEVTP